MRPAPPIKTKSDEAAAEQGCYFDDSEPLAFRKWVETNCVISSGDLAGQLTPMIEWMYKDIVKPLLGWKVMIDGREKLRFRMAGIWTPKKQGKSWLLSALSLWFQRREKGSQVLCIASDVQQAKIVYNECANMLALGTLRDLVGKNQTYWIRHHYNKIQYTDPDGFKGDIQVLSSTPEGKSGFHFNLCSIDEVAEWNATNAQLVWDRLKNAGASRRGLMVVISTPQFNLRHIGKEQYNYAKSVLAGERIDTTFLPVIYGIPEDATCTCGGRHGEGWRCPEWWWKANPSAGITVSKQDYYDDYQSVASNPREEMRWRTLRCGQWVGSPTQWVSSANWNACAAKYTEQELRGSELIAAGIDCSYRGDLTAICYLFRKDNKLYLLPRFFSPEMLAVQKAKADKINYPQMAKDGHIILTPGDVIDPQAIIDQLKADRDYFGDFPIRYDEWGFELMRQKLDEEGFECIPISGQAGIMSPPTGLFERLILDGTIRHNSNPVLDYCLANCVPKIDGYERITITKTGSRNRIDGVIAAIIAVTAIIAEETEDEWLGPMVGVL